MEGDTMKAYLELKDGQWSYIDDDKDCRYVINGSSLYSVLQELKEFYSTVIYRNVEF
jgi:hypothetical protein